MKRSAFTLIELLVVIAI
ncbi:MAG TPA: hypothetical protein DER07_01855, partial [Armatimonadetes bacterium]|nr:hypothetical protein [Armatimonadota bacterium]